MGIDTDTSVQVGSLGWWDDDVLTAANIVPATGLATDYLNVFNEAVMLLGLLPDMPDIIDELHAWQPLTYEQHFVRTGFVAAELAVLAYQRAAPSIRLPFDALSEETGMLLVEAVKRASELLDDQCALALFVKITIPDLHCAIETLNGIIHGGHISGAQDDIDALFG
jgi:hypothetical protein